MLFLKNDCIYLFLEGEGWREKQRERNFNVWLPLTRPLLGTWPTTQAVAVTGNRTGNPLVHWLAPNPLSHTSQDYILYFFKASCKPVDPFLSLTYPMAKSHPEVLPHCPHRGSAATPTAQVRHLARSREEATPPALDRRLTRHPASCLVYLPAQGGEQHTASAERFTGHTENLQIEVRSEHGECNPRNRSVIPVNVGGLKLPSEMQRLGLESQSVCCPPPPSRN